jgi:hypothetical protein
MGIRHQVTYVTLSTCTKGHLQLKITRKNLALTGNNTLTVHKGSLPLMGRRSGTGRGGRATPARRTGGSLLRSRGAYTRKYPETWP